MYRKEFTAEAAQSFAYERKGDSAVIWRCFSHDTKAYIPERIEGCPVTEIVPYAFSAHMDEEELQRGLESGKIQMYVPEAVRRAGEEENMMPDVPLCGDALEEIVLPKMLQSVGRYCFYDCHRLRRIVFCGALTDWGTGVFTRCHHVHELCVYTDQDGRSSLKEVLDELPEEMHVDYRIMGAGGTGEEAADKRQISYMQARLVFPEFYEEGVENTPARILETHVHGSGMSYRNCFQGRKFDFAQYDVLFVRAQALEREEIVCQMAIGRLQTPVGLTEKAVAQYGSYLYEHRYKAAGMLLERRDLETLRRLMEYLSGGRADMQGDRADISKDGDRPKDRVQMQGKEADIQELAEYLTQEASRLHFTEAVSYLMDLTVKGKQRTKKRRRLEL